MVIFQITANKRQYCLDQLCKDLKDYPVVLYIDKKSDLIAPKGSHIYLIENTVDLTWGKNLFDSVQTSMEYIDKNFNDYTHVYRVPNGVMIKKKLPDLSECKSFTNQIYSSKSGSEWIIYCKNHVQKLLESDYYATEFIPGVGCADEYIPYERLDDMENIIEYPYIFRKWYKDAFTKYLTKEELPEALQSNSIMAYKVYDKDVFDELIRIRFDGRYIN